MVEPPRRRNTVAFEEALAGIRRGIAGLGARIRTPFGDRLLCYADLTASGRVFAPVEAFVAALGPYYANSHTFVSSTGAAMTALREQARAAVARSVNAGPGDAVLFAGSGATAAVNVLVGALGLRGSEPRERPVVFVGPYEHHSNELPWLESNADAVEVALGADGRIDLADLESRLVEHAGRALKIGAFSACSNVTGLLTDVAAVARTLHRHGALAFFDYAASAPYVPIDMHPTRDDERLDAIFLSPHKFVGGPQASGVLVAGRALFRDRAPVRPGGGTVDYVARLDRRSVDYSRRIEEREEGGTPAILGDVRAGAALLLKEWLGPERLLERETALARVAVARLARHPAIRLLGSLEAPRLPILSFTVERLHHDFVSALLDHLFGIQNRAGCDCAGPYGHRLLGIDLATSERYRAWIRRGVQGIKPGWVRVSLPYYATEGEIDFILRAVEFVATHGRAFLPLYTLDWRDGVWRQEEHAADPCPLPPLTAEAVLAARAAPEVTPDEAALASEREGYLVEARALAADLEARWSEGSPSFNATTGDRDLDSLVWFDHVRTRGFRR